MNLGAALAPRSCHAATRLTTAGRNPRRLSPPLTDGQPTVSGPAPQPNMKFSSGGRRRLHPWMRLTRPPSAATVG